MNSTLLARPAAVSPPLTSQEEAGIERYAYGSGDPILSIIVPTLDRHRRGLLDRLMRDLQAQDLASFELILVIGDSRQGRAINRGVRAARAGYVATMDDDTQIGGPTLLRTLVECLQQSPDLGMVGASTVLPPEASRFQRLACRQIPRRLFPVVQKLTDSDMVQHPCLAMPKELFERIGGEDEELIRGLDPILRHKVREAGLRVAIAPHCYISHPLPEGYWAVVRMYFRNGKGSAYAQKHHPERVLNLSDGFQKNQFPSKVPFALRALKYPTRMLRSLCRLHFIKLSVETAYMAGYMSEWARGKD